MSDRPGPHISTDGAGRRIARNTGLLFSGKSGSAVIGLVVLVLAARALPVADLGALLLMHAYVTVVAGVATFNSWQAVVRYGTRPLAEGDRDYFHRLLRFSIGLDLAAAVFATAAGMAAFPLIYRLIGLPEEMLVPGLAYCLIIVVNIRNAPTGVLRVIDRFDLMSLQVLITPVIRLAGAAVGLFAGMGLGWFLLVWFVASFVGYLSMPALALRELARRELLKGLFSQRITMRSPEAGVWRFVWLANADWTVRLAGVHLPTLMTGGLFDSAYAALFKVARDIADVLAKGAELLDRAIYPELARMVVAGEAARVLRLITRASLILLGGGLAISAVLAVIGPDLLAFAMGEEFREAARLAVLLLIAASLLGATAPLYPALYAIGKPARAVSARAVGVTSFLVLIVVFSQAFGAPGPGLAAIAGEAIGLAAAAFVTVRSLQSGQAPRSASRTAAVSSGSAGPADKSGGPGQPGSEN